MLFQTQLTILKSCKNAISLKLLVLSTNSTSILDKMALRFQGKEKPMQSHQRESIQLQQTLIVGKSNKAVDYVAN